MKSSSQMIRNEIKQEDSGYPKTLLEASPNLHIIRPNHLPFEREEQSQSLSECSQKQSAQLDSSPILSGPQLIAIHQALQGSRRQLETFMFSLGEIRNTILQQQVLSHISQYNRKFQKLNFALVNEYVRERVRKMKKNGKFKQNWNNNDMKILVWVVGKYCEWKKKSDFQSGLDQSDWKFISSVIPGSQPEMCMFKWLGLRKNRVREQKWQDKEKKILLELVQKYEQKERNWKIIAKELYRLNDSRNKIYRDGKQCREHWHCFLNPTLKKGNWTLEEDIQLLQAIKKEKFKKKWAKLAEEFHGRTENALKNRFSILSNKQIKQYNLSKKTCGKDIVERLLNRYQVLQTSQDKSPKLQDLQRAQRGKSSEISLKFRNIEEKEEEQSLKEPQITRISQLKGIQQEKLLKQVSENPGKYQFLFLSKNIEQKMHV